MVFPTKKLGDVCNVQAGFGFPLNLQGNSVGDFPFFKVSDMNTDREIAILTHANHYLNQDDIKKNGYKVFPAGTVIFPKIGGAIATNKKRILGVDGLYDNNVMGLVPSEKVLSEYLYHWMRLQDISHWSSGTSLPAIKKSFVEDLEIPLPSLAEQKKIVAKLETVLGKIKEAKRLRAEAEAATASLLSAELHKIFEEGMKKGWEEKNLKDISIIKTGGTPSKENEDFWDGDIPWISPKDMKSWIVSDAQDHISQIAVDQSATNLVPPHTILVVVRSGILKHTLPVSLTSRIAAFNQDIKAIVLDAAKVLPLYVAYCLKGNERKILTEGIKQGVTVQSFEGKYLEQFPIPLPSLAEQKKIVAHLDALAAKIAQVRDYQKATAADLVALEKSVLAKAFE